MSAVASSAPTPAQPAKQKQQTYSDPLNAQQCTQQHLVPLLDSLNSQYVYTLTPIVATRKFIKVRAVYTVKPTPEQPLPTQHQMTTIEFTLHYESPKIRKADAKPIRIEYTIEHESTLHVLDVKNDKQAFDAHIGRMMKFKQLYNQQCRVASHATLLADERQFIANRIVL
jgi:hypothetical protein